MLQQLHIENYALIETLDLEFHPGFNLLTGETGSGKSIIVDAVGLLLGAKASAETIRGGANRARVSGIFSLPAAQTAGSAAHRTHPFTQLLAEAGLSAENGEEIVLQREILASGKSRAFINHQPSTVTLLKNLAPFLAEVHGQNEQQELFSPHVQLEMLDRFGGIAALAATVRERFGLWKDLRQKQASLAQQAQERLRQMDLWQFQKREIEQAGIVLGEDQRLEEEKLLLAHATKIQSCLAASFDLLYDSSHSAVASVASANKNLEEVLSYDAALKPLAEALQSAKVSLEDVSLSLRDRMSGIETSPQRLEEVENRLALLERLKRKYGPELEEVLAYGEQVSVQIQEAESSEALSHSLAEKLREATADFQKTAEELSRRRREAARELKIHVEKELKALAMKGTVFEVRLTTSADEPDWRNSGIDRGEFLISPNPGEPLRPLARIASGGEISRTMLALEIVLDARWCSGGSGHSLIFDEVDAGIGGRAAETVGKKLRQLGKHRQVLCVTHLPQIASFAHHHFRVEKSERNRRTTTQVQYLEGEQRTAELARMLSGSQITDAGMKHAAQLLKANS